MTPAEEILKLIESIPEAMREGSAVEVTNRMDEIDARVWIYIAGPGHTFEKMLDCGHCDYTLANGNQCMGLKGSWKQYTRSRDALKQIRPDGWYFGYETGFSGDVPVFSYGCWKKSTEFPGYPMISTRCLPSEECAELYAIIQAIEFERTK